MQSANSAVVDHQHEPDSASTATAPSALKNGSPVTEARLISTPAQPSASGSASSPPEAKLPADPAAKPHTRNRRKWLVLAGAVVAVVLAAYILIPHIMTAFNTVSTDDAYVNGHVTFVAPRVAGQVANVFVDDNYRVKKGDLLVELDKTPYQVQVAIKKASVARAEADLAAAHALARGDVGAMRAARFALEHAIEDVDTQVANLRVAVATLNSSRATLELAQANLKRGEELAPNGAMSKEELQTRQRQVKVNQAAVDQAIQQVYAIRVGLGLPAQPIRSEGLADVPPDLDQDFSSVSQQLGVLFQTASQLGYVPTDINEKPKQAVQEFQKQDPTGNLNNIVAQLVANAPAIKQAEASLLQAKSDLDQAQLNLSYCDVVSEIDGVVASRNANPGDNVQQAQNLMAVRSLTEIWIDANFKETQLADLRIGQQVRCDVDMYGSRKSFEGRITGFTMGTGQTLSLLPPENATGNYVKIVQRLPVRVELTTYDPDKCPLFVGLSVTPYVYYKQAPNGPHAGDILQPLANLPTAPADPRP